MHVTAVMDSINKKQTNTRMKRSHSINDLSNSKRVMKINAREYFSCQRPFTDIKIKLNEEIIWCDKALLAAASPVLCEELLKMNPKDEYLFLNDIDFEEFLLFLQFIYPVFNPEINEQTINCLIKLSHRFEFFILKHACQFYIMKYLNTIRHVSSKYRNSDDYFLNNHNDHPNENECSQQHDLIEFHDGTCINALEIVFNLCQWIQIYFNENNTIVLQSITFILQQISINNLNRVLKSIDIDEKIKAYIYQERAKYLEDIHQIKHIA